MTRRLLLLLLLVGTFWLLPQSADAQSVTLDLGEGGSGGTTARIVQLFLVITIVSIAPSILVMMTSFTRIVVVLSLLRSAMGVQQTPPNMVIVSLSLFLTAFIMMPTLEEIYSEAIEPLSSEEITEQEALERAAMPIRSFMLAHVREQDLMLFLEISETEEEAIDPEETPLQALIPAFMISELRRAFEIGFLMFLPFIIIDMTVASVLMSMGMMMLPPIVMSLPFKLIFFVLVDGWYLVAGSLLRSYSG
jgi:flagellar biosynthetic protein FliP